MVKTFPVPIIITSADAIFCFTIDLHYRIYPKYSDRQACANSVDPDQTPQNAASDQGLRCLQHI